MNRYRAYKTEDSDGADCWFVEDTQTPDDSIIKQRTGNNVYQGPFYRATWAYNLCRRLNRQEKKSQLPQRIKRFLNAV